MQLDALLKAQAALTTISRLVGMIAAPRDNGAMTILGTQGFNQADEPCAARVQRFDSSAAQRLHDLGFTTEPPLIAEPRAARQQANP